MAAAPSLQARCATGPAADATIIADRHLALGAPIPAHALRLIVDTDCSTDRQEASR
jgi:hypothetical protein